MTKRIFRSISLVAMIVLLASLVLIMGALYSYFSQVQLEQLRNETLLTARAVSNEGIIFLEDVASTDCRITWIDSDGTVLYDSVSPSSEMENHLEREEIQQALKTGYGESTRYSATLMERSLYCAQQLPGGTLIRLSIAQDSVFTLVLGLAQPICVVIAVAIVLSFVLAFQLAKGVVKPLNELNLDNPMSNVDYEELTPLLRRIDSQQKQLRYQAVELKRKKTEFDTVTGSMSEGLVLLNGKGIILSMNPSASRQLNIDRSCVGKDFLAMTHYPDVQELIRTSLFGRHAEKNVRLPAGDCQVDASPVLSDGMVTGVVLLIIDVTEKQKAEVLRREFTANVSHELKTPLHSISGYAELMKTGLVQPQDVGQFADKIYSEAQRLIRLVEDIIRLSRLDEGSENMKREQVDLYTLAGEVVSRLLPQAQQAQIDLKLEGCSAVINGFPQQLAAIISNLCSNSIKYNHPGGSVTVSITDDVEFAGLTVADTGIGIPPEHQERVFERFYRVDKSHSKSVGGTGLGLSIVKHAALIHNAKIELHSVPNEGTAISVHFPK